MRFPTLGLMVALTAAVALLPFLATHAAAGTCLGLDNSTSCTGVYDPCPSVCTPQGTELCAGQYDYGARDPCTGVDCVGIQVCVIRP